MFNEEEEEEAEEVQEEEEEGRVEAQRVHMSCFSVPGWATVLNDVKMEKALV